MSAASVADLVESLRKSRLLDAARMEKITKAQDRFPDALSLAKELVRRGWLTREQAKELLQGRPVASDAMASRPVAEATAATNGAAEAAAPVPPAPAVEERRPRRAWLLALLALLLLGVLGGLAVWKFWPGGADGRPGAGHGSTEPFTASISGGCSDTTDPAELKPLDDLEFGKPVRAEFSPKFLDALKDKDGAIPELERYPSWQPPELVAIFGEHRMRNTHIAAHPDGTLLAVAGGQDTFIRIGPIDTLHEKVVLAGHGAGIHALAWSPKGDVLASASGDGTVRLWDVSNLDKVPPPLLLESAAVSSLAFSNDGKYLIGGGAAGPEDPGRGTLWAWDVKERKPLYKKKQAAPVQGVAFSPAPGDYHALSGGGPKDPYLRLWDGVKGEQLMDIEFRAVKDNGEIDKTDGRSQLGQVAFSPDGKQAVSAHFDMDLKAGQGEWKLRVWDLAHFEKDKEKRLLKGFTAAPLVAFGPDNKTVAIASLPTANGLALWDVSGDDKPRPLAQANGISSLIFLPRGEQKEDRVAFGGFPGLEVNVHVHEAATGKELKPPVAHLGPVLAVAGSPDGRHVASGGNEGHARVWELDTVAQRQFVANGNQVWNVGFHPDGKKAFYCGASTATVPFLDVETGKAWGPSPYDKAHAGGITNAVVTEDGHYVLSGGYNDGSVCLWSLEGNKRGKRVRLFPSATPGSAAVALSPTGRRALRTAGTSLKLLHLRCQEVRDEWTGGTWNTFLPDRRVAILGGATGVGVLWDVGEDKPKEAGSTRIPLAGAGPGDVSRDGRRLAAVVGGRVAVWDWQSEKQVWEWVPPAHFGGVRAVALSVDGRYLFTANGDGTVYVIQLP
ncbi:MAG TPA: WD40 repeat domain-containing protein [Gemmataceae bacterium]|nr:WD40 repeat domain-containing protein [Gemmataceae bacterium]